jgi:hypothetical protein
MSTSNGHGGVHHEADEAIDTLYAWMPGLAPALQACPEALFSCTLRGKLDGVETLLTVRGMTAEAFKANLQQVRGLLDQPQPVQAASQSNEWCSLHQVAMQRHENAKGVWHSHYFEGRHCKGR